MLQYVPTPAEALAEIARVTAPNGRIVIVEPDNGARYAHSSLSTGRRAFDAAGRFFEALSAVRGETTDPSIGPKVPTFLAGCGVDVLDVRLFPISHVQLGPPDDASPHAASSTPEQLATYHRNELAMWAEVIKAAGIKPQ